MILDAGLPKHVEVAIEESYAALCHANEQKDVSVAVRSSATAEGAWIFLAVIRVHACVSRIALTQPRLVRKTSLPQVLLDSKHPFSTWLGAEV